MLFAGRSLIPRTPSKAMVFEGGNFKRLSQAEIAACRCGTLCGFWQIAETAGQKAQSGTKAVRQDSPHPTNGADRQADHLVRAPAAALSDPVRFIAYAYVRPSHNNMPVIRRYISSEDFLEALDRALRGSST